MVRQLGWMVGWVLMGALGCGIELDVGGPRPVRSEADDGVGVGIGGGPTVVRTLDTRSPVFAPAPPPPISGGTLLVTRDGQWAVAADPDRDRVSLVSISRQALVKHIELSARDEPGRVIEGSDSVVYIALRRAGAVVALDVITGEVVRRDPVCGAPRGLAYDAETNELHVACAEGRLVTLSPATGEIVRTLQLDADIRDVIVQPERLLVSRFKSAEIIALSKTGEGTERIALGGLMRRSERAESLSLELAGESDSFETGGVVDEAVEPAVAWRILASPDGSTKVLHQYALAEPIQLDDPGGADDPLQPRPVETPYGSSSGFGVPTCGGIVQPGVSTLDEGGSVRMGAPLAAPVLAVDASVSPDGRWIAVAHAGPPDPFGPAPFTPFGGGQISVVNALEPKLDELGGCTSPTFVIHVDGQTTAVAFNPSVDAVARANETWIVAQTREPAALVFYRDPMGTVDAVVSLGGASVADTGHDLFHRDTGAGIACASCHVEGREDGRVWQFEPIGPRRTQALHVGLEGMAPFHWDGDMADFATLMDQVFVGRMGGAPQTPERVDALLHWVGSLEPPQPIRPGDAPEVERGRALFESDRVACASCHSGPVLSNNESVHVGTTDPNHRLQVPSLIGIGYRAPFLHDGCARTLSERFDPSCGGGDAHGKTSHLGPAEIADLVAYLESL